MKTKYLVSLAAAVTVIATITLSLRANDKPKGLVVHEWGTFTSLQGGDGKLISWKPLKTAELPNFVHKWNEPDLGLYSQSMFTLFTKGSIVSLQRMETPVIYFYSDEKRPQPVDVSVRFPQGFITEWYPRATEIGPSLASTNKAVISAIDTKASKESVIRWSGLTLMPAMEVANTHTRLLAKDDSGSHYFAARDTDSDFIAPLMSKTASSDYEKFLFYRGVANFSCPLRVTMQSDDGVLLANTGKETLSHLFVLGIKDKSGNFVQVTELKPGEEKVIAINSKMLAASALNKNISRDMTQALVKSGLYKREATAMVNTWKDSWFAEDGLRVLYVLPRAWTDETLLMDLKPAPSELVRVMVGRAEILRPHIEHTLAANLQKAAAGDNAAADEARKTLHDMGRFAEPAFYRALATAKPQMAEQNKLVALLQSAGKPD